MSTYQTKPIQIESEPYKEGMEDGWIVLYSGEYFDYDKSFKTKQEAIDFINSDLGKQEVTTDEKDYKIIYEDPQPFIMTIRGKKHVSVDDYVIIGIKGDKHPCKKDVFENMYELVK